MANVYVRIWNVVNGINLGRLSGLLTGFSGTWKGVAVSD